MKKFIRLTPRRFAVLLTFCLVSVYSNQICYSAPLPNPINIQSLWDIQDARDHAGENAGDDKTIQAIGIGPKFLSAKKETRSGEFDFTPNFDNALLAVHSDDGTKIEIKGPNVGDTYKLVHNRLGKGQALPKLGKSFYVLNKYIDANGLPTTSVTFTKGKTYKIKISYSNIAYLGKFDIDGMTLYAVSGDSDVIAVLDANDDETYELKVAKWENSFTAAATPTLLGEWVNPDTDSFYIRVKDVGRKNAGKVTVKVSSKNPDSGYDDDATTITLTETVGAGGTGVFECNAKQMMLVSDSVDDKAHAAGVADNDDVNSVNAEANNDRTHKIMLGGTFTIEYVHSNGNTITRDADVKVIKVVTVIPIILRNKTKITGGTEFIDPKDVNKIWKVARERYAQIGILLNWSDPEVVDPPGGVDLTDPNGTLQVTANAADRFLTLEAKTLIEKRGTKTDTTDIHVFYVGRVRVGGITLNGAGMLDSWFNMATDPYLYNLFIGKDPSLPHRGFTAVHELSHCVGELEHTGTKKWQLMYGSATAPGDHLGKKRITTAEATKILSDSHAK